MSVAKEPRRSDWLELCKRALARVRESVFHGRDSWDFSLQCAADGAYAVVIVTEWDAFRALDLTRLGQSTTGKVMVDLRNIYVPAEVEKAGWAYSSVGR